MRGVHLTLAPGEVVLLVGPSGSGKSTLAAMLGGTLEPSAGSVVLRGCDVYRAEERQRRSLLAREVGVVPSPLTLDGALSAEENVLSPARLVGPVGNAERARASRLLVRLGLGERRKHRPEHLSGGERKRVAVAQALMNDPAVVLADEPTGDLDSARSRQVMMLLRALAHDDDKGVLVVASDPRAEEVADRIL